MSDLIDRKDLGAAIDNWLAIDRYYHPHSKQKTIPVSELVDIIKLLPSAQPEITLESAIDYLHSIGWMQEHDRIMVESAQPEIIRCKDCKHYMQTSCPMTGTWATDEDFCSFGERRSCK